MRDGLWSANYKANRKNWVAMAPAWLFTAAPAHTIYGAWDDACKAMAAVWQKRKNGESAELHFLRRSKQTSFFLLGNAITAKSIYPMKLGKYLRTTEPLPEKGSDSRIMLIAGKWYLSTPYTKKSELRAENQGQLCALDPGVRTFLTGYSSNGVVEIGSAAFNRIVRLAYHLDDLLSRASKAGKQRKRAMLLAAERMRRRVANLIDDLHYQTAHYLTDNFGAILLPEFSATGMVGKAKRKLRRKSVRALLTLSHSKFRTRLLHIAALKGVLVFHPTEEYTSKTAAWSGEIKPKLGGARFIQSAGYRIGRDINGALGIFLKGFVGIHQGEILPASDYA